MIQMWPGWCISDRSHESKVLLEVLPECVAKVFLRISINPQSLGNPDSLRRVFLQLSWACFWLLICQQQQQQQQQQTTTNNNKQQQTTTNNNKQQQTTTNNNKQQQTTTNNNKQQQTTTNNNKQQQTTTNNNKQQQTTTNNNKQQQTTTNNNKQQQTTTNNNKQQQTTTNNNKQQQTTTNNNKQQQTTTNNNKQQQTTTNNNNNNNNNNKSSGIHWITVLNDNSQHINLIIRIVFPIEDGPMSRNDRASIGCLQHSFDLTTCRAHAVAFAPEGYNEKPRKPLKGQSWEPSVNGCDLQAAKHGVFQVYWLLTESSIDWSLEPEITTLHWLFQVDDSKSLYENGCFHQTSI